MDFVHIRKLNDKLKETYGTNLDGRPFFRLSWSNAQRESRWGVFREFLEGTKIFLREFTGVSKDRQKYPWIKDRWILEKLMFPARAYKYWSPELIGVDNGSYEPVWVFRWKDKSDPTGEKDLYQRPEWYPITKLVYKALYGPDMADRMTPSDIEDANNRAFDSEVKDLEEYFGNESSEFGLVDGSGAFISSKQFAGTELNQSKEIKEKLTTKKTESFVDKLKSKKAKSHKCHIQYINA
jgi:hypothetical protein